MRKITYNEPETQEIIDAFVEYQMEYPEWELYINEEIGFPAVAYKGTKDEGICILAFSNLNLIVIGFYHDDFPIYPEKTKIGSIGNIQCETPQNALDIMHSFITSDLLQLAETGSLFNVLSQNQTIH